MAPATTPVPAPVPASSGPVPARTARRGWLIAALAAAVAMLLGSFVAVAAWSGAVRDGGAGPRVGPGSDSQEFRRQDGRGPGMMEGRGGPDRGDPRSGPPGGMMDHMRDWDHS